MIYSQIVHQFLKIFFQKKSFLKKSFQNLKTFFKKDFFLKENLKN